MTRGQKNKNLWDELAQGKMDEDMTKIAVVSAMTVLFIVLAFFIDKTKKGDNEKKR